VAGGKRNIIGCPSFSGNRLDGHPKLDNRFPFYSDCLRNSLRKYPQEYRDFLPVID